MADLSRAKRHKIDEFTLPTCGFLDGTLKNQVVLRRPLDVSWVLLWMVVDKIRRYEPGIVEIIRRMTDVPIRHDVPMDFFVFSPVEHIEIPSYVTNIRARAFMGSNLKTIDICRPLHISNSALAMTNLVSITFPSETILDGLVCEDCVFLEEVIFLGNASIGTRAFQNCHRLAYVRGEGTLKIEYRAFEKCKLKEIRCNDMHLEEGAFQDTQLMHVSCSEISLCDNVFTDTELECITTDIPIHRLYDRCFANTRLTRMPVITTTRIPAGCFIHSWITTIDLQGIEEILSRAFSSMPYLTKACFHGKNVHLYEHAFQFCRVLHEVSFSHEITVDKSAFAGCLRLKHIDCPFIHVKSSGYYESHLTSCHVDHNTEIGAFQHSRVATIKFYKGLTQIPRGIFSYTRCLTHVALPDTIAVICDSAFSYSALVEISGAGVLTIEIYAFCGCKNLRLAFFPKAISVHSKAFLHAGISSTTVSP